MCLKDLKDSTRQRMVAIELDFPPADVEEKVVAHEAGVEPEVAAQLVRLAQAIRRLETARSAGGGLNPGADRRRTAVRRRRAVGYRGAGRHRRAAHR